MRFFCGNWTKADTVGGEDTKRPAGVFAPAGRILPRVYLKTVNAPGQRAFSRCAASFFLEIRQYSCEKMSCSARKFLAAGHITSFQIHPSQALHQGEPLNIMEKKANHFSGQLGFVLAAARPSDGARPLLVRSASTQKPPAGAAAPAGGFCVSVIQSQAVWTRRGPPSASAASRAKRRHCTRP